MLFRRFLNDETGASAIEYALIAGLVSVSSILALTNAGTSAETLFGSVPPLLSALGSAGNG